MSFDQLSSIESGAGRRGTGGGGSSYSDDPEFSQVSQSMMNKLFHLQGNIEKIRTDIGLLGTRRDNARLRERVTALLEESTEGFKEVGQGVKKVQSWQDATPTQKYSQRKLSEGFKTALGEFQSLQRSALEKQKASVTAAKAASTDEEHTAASFSGQQQQQQQQQQYGGQQQLQLQGPELHLAQQDETDFQEALIIEREEEIRHIEEGVSDLNVLFKQVAQIVGEQGEQLQTIEDNAINVRDDTRGADYELRSASRYQKAARGKACCLLVVIVIIVVIVLLAVFLG